MGEVGKLITETLPQGEFLKDPRHGFWDVEIRFNGTYRETIEAASAAEAEQILKGRIEDGGLDVMPEDLDDWSVDRVRPEPAMYLVLRDGEELRTSRVTATDQPRQPNDRGF